MKKNPTYTRLFFQQKVPPTYAFIPTYTLILFFFVLQYFLSYETNVSHILHEI